MKEKISTRIISFNNKKIEAALVFKLELNLIDKATFEAQYPNATEDELPVIKVAKVSAAGIDVEVKKEDIDPYYENKIDESLVDQAIQAWCKKAELALQILS